MHSRSIRRRGLVAVAAALVVALAVSSTALSAPAQAGAKHHRGAKVVKESGLRDKVPQFTRDASYPAALPNNWAWGGAGWAQADTRDHVWFLHRPLQVPAVDLLAGKIAAPAVVELDEDGDFVRGWGGTAWLNPWFVGSFGQTGEYPADTPPEHGIYVDSDRNVWVTGHGSVVLKFNRNGRLLLTIGTFGQTGGSNSTTLLGNPTDMYVDTKANEVYVSDGYLNRRVVVFDSETGAYKRHWGAYGNVPDDGPPELYQQGQPLPQQFFVLHCIDVSKDGLVYVCDRQRNRIQVFTKSGKFVKEVVHTPDAPAGGGITVKGPFGNPAVSGAGFGSGNSLALSADAAQEFLYITAPPGIKIFRRRTLEFLGSFAAGGGHGLTSDGDGNLYTAGREKFELTGYAKAPKQVATSSR
jgi:NHL repeat